MQKGSLVYWHFVSRMLVICACVVCIRVPAQGLWHRVGTASLHDIHRGPLHPV